MRIASLACLLLVLHGFVRAETHDDIAGKPDLVVNDASTLKKTLVLGALQQKHVEGRNLVWCSTLQLCWNLLMKNEGGAVELKDASELVTFLNEKLADDTQVDPAAVFTYVGTGPGAPKDLLAKLQKHFGGQASPKLIPEDVREQQTILYSYLFRNLPFDVQMERSAQPMTFRGASVAQFGVWPFSKNRWEMVGQVRIHDYAGPEDFVVELRTAANDERLIVARISPQETLQKSAEWALARLNREPVRWLKDDETFAMPVLNFELTKRFPELQQAIGKPTGSALLDVQQLIRFRLDEKGAVLKSEASAKKEESKENEKPKPRQLIFDGPFIIVLVNRGVRIPVFKKEDAKVPYFAAWIDNEELLVPYKHPPVEPRGGCEGNIDD